MSGRTVRDRVASFNERVKLFAQFLNTLGLGLIAIGVVTPMVTPPAPASLIQPDAATQFILPDDWPTLPLPEDQLRDGMEAMDQMKRGLGEPIPGLAGELPFWTP